MTSDVRTGEGADFGAPLSIGQVATWACLLEASIPKPGNVHRGADFEDLSYYDFVAAAIAIGPAMDGAAAAPSLGTTVLAATRATREVAATNVNLGIVLLLAPLARVPREVDLRSGVRQVLGSLTPDDARLVYEAIRLANPGGLGRSESDDVAGPPPSDLIAAMRSAADRDLIAGQYANGFAEVFDLAVPAIMQGVGSGWALGDAVIRTHLRLMHERPDTLIARKLGREAAEQAAEYAGQVLRSGEPGDENYAEALADFDFWLRSDGHRRNPGTTADLIAAALYVVLRDRIVPVPLRV